MMSSLLITYLVFTGYRLAIQENLQWRSLKQAQYLKELDQMKTNFLSLVSHDLKTPLAKIQAIAERMRRELQLPLEERSDWKDLIDSIENSNGEMKRYISSILNLSKIESQKVILNMKSNDVNLLIQQALKRLSPLAAQKNISFEEHLEPLFSIECDEDLMRQVLTNLIDNAIKYSPNGSKVIVRSKEEDNFVQVEVEDFGPGIPRDQLPLMFRKFSRSLRPIKEEVKGSGLGLYLSKYFIELHGGTIRLKSTEGKGTTFSFNLPLHGTEGGTILG
jgi:signal transduction histidine kinase